MTAVCPYCSSPIDEAEPNRCFCTVCGTAHHTDCWAENGGCTVFGCSAAPPEEPKVTVDASDLSTTAVPAPPPVAAESAPPLPPPPPVPRTPITLTLGGYAPPAAVTYQPPVTAFPQDRPKSRAAFVLLGIFLGVFGAHNFYAGYTGRAIAQLLITVCTLFIGSVVSWIWAIVEVCTVEKDSRNIQMV